MDSEALVRELLVASGNNLEETEARLLLLSERRRQEKYVCYWEPTPEQRQFWDQKIYERKLWLVSGGERCLGAGTPVATPLGPMPIEQLSSGDLVYATDGSPVKVLQRWENGEREVWRWHGKRFRRDVYFDATRCHKVLQASQKDCRPRLRPLDSLSRRGYFVLADGIALGETSNPCALAIGLVLGDGYLGGKGAIQWTCAELDLVEELRGYFRGLEIQVQSHGIQHMLHSLKRPKLLRCAQTGQVLGTASQDAFKAELERLGLLGRLSKDKFIPKEVWGWKREDVAQLLGGLIATDGSVYQARADWGWHFNYTSKSRDLIEGFVQLLEHGFGVYGGTIRKGSKGTWGVTHRGSQALERLAALPVPGRKGRLLRQIVKGKQYRGSYVPVVDHELLGWQPTYDLLIDHPSHTFQLSNGVQVSNSGKTELGAFLTTVWLLGKEYFRNEPAWKWVEPLPVPPVPTSVRAVGLTADTSRNSVWEKLMGATEHAPVFPPSTIRAHSEHELNAEFKNKSQFHIKSAETKPKTHGAVSVHFVWIDEECDFEILRMNEQRTVTTGGKILVTATPYDAVENTPHPWMFDYIEKWRSGDPDIGVIHLDSTKNPYTSDEEKRRMLKRFEGSAEGPARLYGIPTIRSGRYYKQWRAEPPLWVPGDELLAQGFRAVMIDPAVTGTAGALWAHFDTKGKMRLYREYKEKGRTVSGHVEAILVENRGDPINLWLCDPFMGRQRVPDSQSRDQHKTVLQVWREAGLTRLQAADINYDACLARSQEYLQAAFDRTAPHPAVEVWDHLEKFRWEMERYVIDTVIQGPNRGEARDRPRKGRDGASTLMECYQYLCGLGLRARPLSTAPQRPVHSMNYFA